MTKHLTLTGQFSGGTYCGKEKSGDEFCHMPYINDKKKDDFLKTICIDCADIYNDRPIRKLIRNNSK